MRRPGAKAPQPMAPATSGNAITAISRGLNRNLLVLGIAVLVLLGGLGIYLALTTKGDTYQTREERISEIIRNQYFTDLIASGKTTRKELLGLWDIRPYGLGFVGVSNETRTWEQAAELAGRTGSTILMVDPADAVARPLMLNWLAEVTTDLDGATLWLLDNGEPKVLHAPEMSRVCWPGTGGFPIKRTNREFS